MRERLRAPAGQATYSRRKVIVEPVHGQIKGARGLRDLPLRGLSKVRGENTLICTTHDILKLFGAGGRPATLLATRNGTSGERPAGAHPERSGATTESTSS